MSLLQRILKSGAETHYERGMQAFNEGRHAEALGAFECSLEIVQDSSDPVASLARFYAAEALTRLGYTDLQEGRPGDARRRFDQARKSNTRFPDLHFYAAVAEALLGLYESSSNSLRQVLDLDGEHLGARCLLGFVLHRLGHAEDARRELDWVEKNATRLRHPLPGFLLDLLLAHTTSIPGLASVLRKLERAGDRAAEPPASSRAQTQTA